MSEAKRPPRIVTVCVGGMRPRKPGENRRSVRVLDAVIDAITASNWHPIDAVVFPGGFFRIRGPFANLGFAERAAAISATEPGKAVQRGVLRLQKASGRTLLVTGMDGTCLGLGEREDQLCVAFGEAGIVGLARKIILTEKDGRGKRPIVPGASDFSSSERFVTLPNGDKAALCACYDLFGFDIPPEGSSVKARSIRALWSEGRIVRKADRDFAALRSHCFREWRELWQLESPDIAIAAAHGFDRPGQDGYWQRHGVAASSAALGGALTVTAAYFYDYLPDEGVSPLAAYKVGAGHLRRKNYRPARPFLPSAEIEVAYGGYLQAVVRLYTP